MKNACAILLFVFASLLPALCIISAVFFGGLWPLIAFLSVTVFVIAMDRAGFETHAEARQTEWLPVVVGAAHFCVLYGTVWAVGQSDLLSLGQKILLVVATGLFAGQVSNSCAHELIHRSDRALRRFGVAIYSSVLNGQHVSAHLLLHHVHAGTVQDPNSPPLGRGYYRFAWVAAREELLAGWRAETQRRKRGSRGLHPYAIYIAGAAVSLLLALLLGGVWGLVALIAISLHAQSQLLLSDYVQHYGLRRALAADGKPEPFGPQHSWNAPHPYSAALMMNAPRHSDHHSNPSRGFSDLRVQEDVMPMLPYSLPVMGALALVPPLWRRTMDSRVADWANMPRKSKISATATRAEPSHSKDKTHAKLYS